MYFFIIGLLIALEIAIGVTFDEKGWFTIIACILTGFFHVYKPFLSKIFKWLV